MHSIRQKNLKLKGAKEMAFFSRKAKERAIPIDSFNHHQVVLSISDENICNQVRALGLTLEDLKMAKSSIPKFPYTEN